MTRSGPWALILLFVFAAVSLSAQPTQAQLEQGAVKGTVCGDPYECWQGLPGATVTLTRTDGVLPHEQTTTTDEAGTFWFDQVPHGSYELAAERRGFSSGNASLTVDGSESAQIRLEPQAVFVALRVVDGDGGGLDALASWYSETASGHAEVVDGAATIETRSGYHTLTVESPGFSRSDQWLLLDGGDVTVEMSPVPPQDAVVLGTVRDQDGGPVAGAEVRVYQYGHEYYGETAASDSGSSGGSDDAPQAMPVREPYYGGSNRTTTAADGSYRIHVWSGDVELSIHKEGHAGRSAYFQVDSGKEYRHDVELPRFPEKTAHVEGRVLGQDGKPLQNVRLSIWLPEYGIHECSSEDGAGGGSNGTTGSAGGADGAEPAPDSLTYPAPEREGCAITLHDDGTFEGMLTPGYAIVEAWHDHWRTCSESRGSDGSMSRTCGPEYLGYSRTLVLAADDTTELVIQMRARPAADATISGYVVDGESQTAIPGVQVQFNNEETYGWGSASTDGDGSYKVGVRGGYHRVYVHAEGYLPWQGVVQVPAGGEVSLDVVLTPGQAEYGYCCYAYDDDVAYASDGAKAESAPSESSPSMGAGDAEEGSDDSGHSEGEAVQDLGGGLGPYDPQKRAQELQESGKDSPGPAVVLLALALVGAAVASRRHR